MTVYQLPKRFKLQQWQDVLPLKIIRNRNTVFKKKQMTTEELTIEVHKALEEIRPFEF
jgi:hypothetical protein